MSNLFLILGIKMTMEIADQLIGVTMQETGVLRLVPVDIDTTVDMVKV
jgi:chromosome segregation ATPase